MHDWAVIEEGAARALQVHERGPNTIGGEAYLKPILLWARLVSLRIVSTMMSSTATMLKSRARYDDARSRRMRLRSIIQSTVTRSHHSD
jgi:hypothetical protein